MVLEVSDKRELRKKMPKGSRRSQSKELNVKIQYLVKWVPSLGRADSWEEASDLQLHCTDKIDQYEDLQDQINAKRAKKLYRCVDLNQLLPPDKLTLTQQFSEFAKSVRDIRMEDGGWPGDITNPVLSCRDREISDDIARQIIQILNGFQPDGYEVGQIVDESNPAMRFTDACLHKGTSMGLFATKRLPADYVVGEYVGTVEKYADCQRGTDLETELEQTSLFDLIESQKWGSGRSVCPIGDTLVLDPNKRCNALVYMNDFRSDDYTKQRKQNLKFHEVLVNGWPHIYAITKTEIAPGAELLTDYGKGWWENFRIIVRRQNQLKAMKSKWLSSSQEVARQNEELNKTVAALRDELAAQKEETKRLRALLPAATRQSPAKRQKQ
mmetsp:Transcript_28085/g.55252  ORF Transcript_28085/g.55252 Transcript_28085/m.55252 type:complete len:383 (+) Transcript_28085:935-2083(+)